MVSKIFGPAALIAVMLTAGCSPTVTYRGFQETKTLQESANIGVTTKSALLSRFGAPSVRGTAKTGDSWYYISYREERFAFFHPEVTERNVIALSFDRQGVLQEKEELTLADGKAISVNGDKTPVYAKDLNVVQQILSNVGRFNDRGSLSPDGSVLGRRPGGL